MAKTTQRNGGASRVKCWVAVYRNPTYAAMEEEVRQILRDALGAEQEQTGLGSRLHRRVLDLTGGVEIELPRRSTPRPPPEFGA